jgi:hypothetical protein
MSTSAPPTNSPGKAAKKIPKWFWPVGIGVALVIGLYLRSRNNSATASGSTSTNGETPASDVTGEPYTYDSSGATPDSQDIDPYGSLEGSTGTGSTFDPTSFEEGEEIAQQELGEVSTGNVPATVGSTPGTPGNINITIPPAHGKTSGKPVKSGRRVSGATSNRRHDTTTSHTKQPSKKPSRKAHHYKVPKDTDKR